jgi:hypothetical protein
MRPRRSQTRFASVAALLILIATVVSSAIASGSDDASKRVKIIGGGVELIEITPSAPKCPSKQKGETIRLKVTSETPIDVRLYIQTGFHQWIDKDFPNQKRGDEITSYRCDQKPNYKIYSHAAGSTDAWPKP